MKNNTDTKLRVTEIQRFCMHDGPGLRTTVFLKGCPLRCAWCHNPETQKKASELLFYPTKCIFCGYCVSVCDFDVHILNDCHIVDREKCVACGKCAEICPTQALETCGKEYSVQEILSVVEKDKAFYGAAGGVTVSGGEPFWQGEGTVELLRECKRRGLSTAVETCGYFDKKHMSSAVELTDLFLWDIKDTDDGRHLKYAGVSNKKILENINLANELGAKIRLRCILVNGVNTDEKHYRSIAEIALSLKNCEGVEILPYHAYAGTKAIFIGREDNGVKEWIPSAEQIESAKQILISYDINVF